jgi:hypothetical protein
MQGDGPPDLEQADGTAWMVLYSQTMLEIAIELEHDLTEPIR